MDISVNLHTNNDTTFNVDLLRRPDGEEFISLQIQGVGYPSASVYISRDKLAELRDAIDGFLTPKAEAA